MDYDSIGPSRELDSVIAARVMGWSNVVFSYEDEPEFYEEWAYGTPPNGQETGVPEYSTDIADAWLVVDKLLQEGIGVQVWTAQLPDGLWRAQFSSALPSDFIGKGSTPAGAICRAALKAVMPLTSPKQ